MICKIRAISALLYISSTSLSWVLHLYQSNVRWSRVAIEQVKLRPRHQRGWNTVSKTPTASPVWDTEIPNLKVMGHRWGIQLNSFFGPGLRRPRCRSCASLAIVYTSPRGTFHKCAQPWNDKRVAWCTRVRTDHYLFIYLGRLRVCSQHPVRRW